MAEHKGNWKVKIFMNRKKKDSFELYKNAFEKLSNSRIPRVSTLDGIRKCFGHYSEESVTILAKFIIWFFQNISSWFPKWTNYMP